MSPPTIAQGIITHFNPCTHYSGVYHTKLFHHVHRNCLGTTSRKVWRKRHRWDRAGSVPTLPCRSHRRRRRRRCDVLSRHVQIKRRVINDGPLYQNEIFLPRQETAPRELAADPGLTGRKTRDDVRRRDANSGQVNCRQKRSFDELIGIQWWTSISGDLCNTTFSFFLRPCEPRKT